MGRDTDRYIYVEVALPKDNEAIQNMIAESESEHTPLRTLIKQACIKVYSGEVVEQTRIAKPVKKQPLEDAAGEQQYQSAALLLNQLGILDE